MERVCFSLPILPGMTDAARAFMRELETVLKEEYAASERRIGIEREFWFLQHTDRGDIYVAYMESPNFAHALQAFGASNDPFDMWFKERMLAVTGLDFSTAPEGPLSELLSSYEVPMASTAP